MLIYFSSTLALFSFLQLFYSWKLWKPRSKLGLGKGRRHMQLIPTPATARKSRAEAQELISAPYRARGSRRTGSPGFSGVRGRILGLGALGVYGCWG